jgi:hypothetical protein
MSGRQQIVKSFLPESEESNMSENIAILEGATALLGLAGDNASSLVFEKIPPQLALENFGILFKYYELVKILEKSRIRPEQTVISGSGLRADEVMAFRDSARVNILSAEPHRAYNAKSASEAFKFLGIEHSVFRSAKSLRGNFEGIVLTDDTHKDIENIFRDRRVDELAIIRIDPDVFLGRGKIDDLSGAEEIVQMQTQATLALVDLLSIVDEGGEATVTVGAGNSALAYLMRRTLIYGLEQLCIKTGIEHELIGSPWLDLVFKNGLSTNINNPVIGGIISAATIDGIRIHSSTILKNLPSLLRIRHFQPNFNRAMISALEKAHDDDLAERLNII